MIAYAVILDASGSRSVSGERKTLRGFARVAVLGVSGAGAQVEILAGSGPMRALAGWQFTVPTKDLYASKDERAYFGKLAMWFTTGETPPGDRPPVSLEAS